MGETRGKQWVDFRELKATVTFDAVLERLDALTSLKRIGDELQGPCPICRHGNEKSRSFNVNVAKQIFQCFACKRKGNVLDFTAAMRQTDVHGAALWLREEFLHNTGHQPPAEHPRDESSAEGATTPGDDTPKPPPSVHTTAARSALTDREFWLLDLMAQATAFALAQRFSSMTDVESLHKDILQMVEVHGNISEQH